MVLPALYDPDVDAMDHARGTLKHLTRVVLALVVDICAARFGVSPAAIRHITADRTSLNSDQRSLARSAAMGLLYTGLGWKQSRIAKFFGVARPTVACACRRVSDCRDQDAELDAWLSAIEQLLQREEP